MYDSVSPPGNVSTTRSSSPTTVAAPAGTGGAGVPVCLDRNQSIENVACIVGGVPNGVPLFRPLLGDQVCIDCIDEVCWAVHGLCVDNVREVSTLLTHLDCHFSYIVLRHVTHCFTTVGMHSQMLQLPQGSCSSIGCLEMRCVGGSERIAGFPSFSAAALRPVDA